MINYHTHGIILKRFNLKETDKIITVLTEYHGKVKYIAPGVRKITSRKAPHLEPFCHTILYITKGKNLDIITEASLVDSYQNIRTDLNRIAVGYHICELVDKLTAENQINRSLFGLLITTFSKLNDVTTDCNQVMNDFSIQILWDLGYLPKGTEVTGISISQYVENVAERKIKSRNLLTRINGLLQ